jgi:hypothetical protein
VSKELLRTLRTEVPLNVRVYINKSWEVDYAELLSDITAVNRDFASLAVFDARTGNSNRPDREDALCPGERCCDIGSAIRCSLFCPIRTDQSQRSMV